MGRPADHQPNFRRFLQWCHAINHRPSRTKCGGQQRHSSKTHTLFPDYKPLPLRWPFLGVVFLYICTLVALLEYALHTLPVVNDRISGFRPQTIGNSQSTTAAALSTAATRDAMWRRKPSTLPQQVPATPTPDIATSTSTLTRPTPLGDHGLTTVATTNTADVSPLQTGGLTTDLSSESYIRPTSFPAWTYSRPNHTNWESLGQRASASVLIANRPEPWEYARLGRDSVLAHYVLAFVWTHGPDNFLATPVPPGVEVSDRCVKHNVMGWVTHDPDDCPVLIPLVVWENPDFSGAFGPIRGGSAFFDADCRRNDDEQVALLDPYWDQPDCWADEAANMTILHFPKTIDPNESIQKTTRVVPGAGGQLVTFVERVTLGSDVATIHLNPSQVLTSTRQRTDTNPVPGVVATLTDPLGRPTATVTSFPFGFSRHAIPITLRNSVGMPTATTWEYESLDSRVRTITDEQGIPTATLTEYFRKHPTTSSFPFVPDPYHPTGDRILFFGPLSNAEYLAGSFLPVFLSTMLAILVKLMQADIQSLLPFHALTRPGGARASDSLYLAPGGIRGPLTSWRMLREFHEPLAILSDILVILSALAVSISSEAVGVTLVGDCSPRALRGCFLSLSVVLAPARAAEAVMICVAALVVIMGFLLCQWRTGIATNPWSIDNIASLAPRGVGAISTLSRPCNSSRGMEIRLTENEIANARFALGYYTNTNDEVDGSSYGIVAWCDCAECGQPVAISPDMWLLDIGQFDTRQIMRKRSFVARNITVLCFIGLLCGFSIVIVVYETTRTANSFEQFMNGQNFGNSFLFTSLGVALSFFWDAFYSCKYLSTTLLYTRLSIVVTHQNS